MIITSSSSAKTNCNKLLLLLLHFSTKKLLFLPNMLLPTRSSHQMNIASTILLHSIRLLSTASSKAPLFLESYTVTPPLKRWPQTLHPKRLISLIAQEQNLDLAFQIFDYAGKYHPGFSHNYDTYYSIINKLSRGRAFDPMESLLSELQKSQIKCGEDVFITVIRNYGLAGKPKLALKMFVRIKEFNLQPSVKSMNTLLNVFVQNKSYDLVHSTFKNSKSKYGVLPNIVSCNILIKALCKKNDVQGAIEVVDEMPSMGMIPNVVTYTTILGGYVSRGDLINAKKVLDNLLDKGWLPDATTYTILMDGYCKQGKLSDAIKVMDDMEDNGIKPNEVTYGVMIEAYCNGKKSGEACNLIDDMLDRRYVPSPTLCCKVIDALCQDGKVEDACNFWKRMLKKNCMPDNAILSTLIHWLCKEGKVWEARKLFNEFERVPSLLTYNTLIAGMCERGELSEAGRLWDDMVEKHRRPNVFTYTMLIKGFTKVGNVKEGVRILEEMLDKGCLPNKLTYMILIEGLCNSGMEQHVEKVISSGIACGRVDSESWDLLLNKVVSNLDSGAGALDGLLMEIAT